jgi:hypothetical protein
MVKQEAKMNLNPHQKAARQALGTAGVLIEAGNYTGAIEVLREQYDAAVFGPGDISILIVCCEVAEEKRGLAAAGAAVLWAQMAIEAMRGIPGAYDRYKQFETGALGLIYQHDQGGNN